MLPAVLAFIVSIFYFKGRVTGVVFAILTQSMVACIWYFIVGNQGYFGGINGITDLKTLNGWDIRTEGAQRTLYFFSTIVLLLCILISRYVLSAGLVGFANSNKMRCVLYFIPRLYVVRWVLSAIGGAMFTLQVGFMSPNLIGIQPSIDMVIFTAVGGRKPVGCRLRSTCCERCEEAFSKAYPTLWMFSWSDFHHDRSLPAQGPRGTLSRPD